jgi:hypothetical protein
VRKLKAGRVASSAQPVFAQCVSKDVGISRDYGSARRPIAVAGRSERVAVVKGFEPLEGVNPHTLSRRAP